MIIIVFFHSVLFCSLLQYTIILDYTHCSIVGSYLVQMTL